MAFNIAPVGYAGTDDEQENKNQENHLLNHEMQATHTKSECGYQLSD